MKNYRKIAQHYSCHENFMNTTVDKETLKKKEIKKNF